MIAYKKTAGRAHDLRPVPEDYVPVEGEILIDGAELPPLESLHDAPTIDDLRATRWAKIKAARDAERDAGFAYNTKLLQSDPVSRVNIAGAAQAASIAKAAAQSFSVTWTCADNSLMVLDADGAIAMFMAGVQHMQALYAKGVQLRDQINAAVTAEAIAAITW